MTNQIEELLRAASYITSAPPQATAVLVADGGSASSVRSSDGLAPGLQDAGSVAVEIKKLVDVSTAAQVANTAPPRASASTRVAAEEASVGETIARTAATITGVGPIVTGLMKIFGSSEPEPLPPLEKFSAPPRVSVEAGLTRDREYSGVRYAQGGDPEAVGIAGAARASAPTIQVNVSAMDSQSFVDRRDDIARAVREAMLHSNALNDVVLEL